MEKAKQGVKSRARSWTYRSAAFLAVVLAPLETKFQLLQGMLGEYYGLSFVAVAMLMAFLREITSKPIGER